MIDEEPELRKLVPVVLNDFGGTVIGHVLVEDHDTQKVMITDEAYAALLDAFKIDSYSIVDLEHEEIDPEMMKLFEEFPPGRFTGEKTKITIRSKTDGKSE